MAMATKKEQKTSYLHNILHLKLNHSKLRTDVLTAERRKKKKDMTMTKEKVGDCSEECLWIPPRVNESVPLYPDLVFELLPILPPWLEVQRDKEARRGQRVRDASSSERSVELWKEPRPSIKSISLYICIYIHTYIHTYVCVQCMYVCMCICTYIHYTYVHTHTHMYIYHICMHIALLRFFRL